MHKGQRHHLNPACGIRCGHPTRVSTGPDPDGRQTPWLYTATHSGEQGTRLGSLGEPMGSRGGVRGVVGSREARPPAWFWGSRQHRGPGRPDRGCCLCAPLRPPRPAASLRRRKGGPTQRRRTESDPRGDCGRHVCNGRPGALPWSAHVPCPRGLPAAPTRPGRQNELLHADPSASTSPGPRKPRIIRESIFPEGWVARTLRSYK